MSFFKLSPSGTAHCDRVGEMAVTGSASKFKVSVAAMTDIKQARIGATLNLSGAHAARKVTATSKALQLTAGTATQVRLKFSRSALSAISAAVRRHHRLFGKLTLSGKSLANRTATITRTIQLR